MVMIKHYDHGGDSYVARVHAVVAYGCLQLHVHKWCACADSMSVDSHYLAHGHVFAVAVVFSG